MAANANNDRVRADIRPPDFRAAVDKIRSIKPKKEKIASFNGEIADIFAKIEGHKVNKQAARFFAKLDALESADRADVLRSLNGLCDAAGWPADSADLVDQSENKVVPMRVGKTAANEDGGADKEPGDEEEPEGEEEPESPRRARRGRGLAGLDKARGHLGGSDNRPAP